MTNELEIYDITIYIDQNTYNVKYTNDIEGPILEYVYLSIDNFNIPMPYKWIHQNYEDICECIVEKLQAESKFDFGNNYNYI